MSNPFNLDSVRESLQRIVTTTQLRGFGRLCPTPHVPDCCVDEVGCQAGAVKGIHELEVYASSSCDPRCHRECPHATTFPGVPAPSDGT